MSKEAAFWASLTTSILFAAWIFLVFSGNFAPDDKHGVAVAIVSSIRVASVTGAMSVVHAFFECYYNMANLRPGVTEVPWKRNVDVAVSYLPLFMLIFTIFEWNAGMVGKVVWWSTLESWMALLVILALLPDVYFTTARLFSGKK